MLTAKSLGDILNEELLLWTEKLRLADHWAAAKSTYLAIPERQRLLVALVLAVLGLLLAGWSWYRRSRPSAGQILRRWKASGARAAAITETVTGPARSQSGEAAIAPEAAFLVTQDREGRRLSLSSEVVRIGRHEENDVRLRDKTVHRYHALVHHTNDGEFIIKDLSGTGGNGVYVNGRRIGERQLAPGDLVELGAVKLRFVSERASLRA
jgi:hypothetical protein